MKSYIGCFFIFPLFLTSSLFSVTGPRLVCPDEVRPIILDYIGSNKVLANEQFNDSLQQYLIKEGYSFAQVDTTESLGIITIEIKAGFYGKPTISGNDYLSESTILNNLAWDSGELFNYKEFYTQSSRLNRNRFIKLDTKLKPIRSNDGEIQVNADFTVKDSFPITPYIKISNDGTEQSSGWRTTAGFEIWEGLFSNDRVNLAYTLDPKDASQLSSYFASYQINYNRLAHTIYAGYSDSEYENVTSSSLNMDIAGDGFFAGYTGAFSFGSSDPESFALTFGFSYLNLESQIYLVSNRLLASSEDLSLLLPRIGFRGKTSNLGIFRGNSFWSILAVSDLSSSKNEELIVQNPELRKGFWVPKASFALIEPISFSGENGGIKLKLDGQASNKPLPTSLKKSLGGMSSIRGYKEREAFGDSGVSLNLEYSLESEISSIFGFDGTLQKIFFYDAGHVSNEGLMSSVNDSVDMHSFGVGILGNFEDITDISLQVGVPLTDTLNTRTHETRTHFSINFRF